MSRRIYLKFVSRFSESQNKHGEIVAKANEGNRAEIKGFSMQVLETIMRMKKIEWYGRLGLNHCRTIKSTRQNLTSTKTYLKNISDFYDLSHNYNALRHRCGQLLCDCEPEAA